MRALPWLAALMVACGTGASGPGGGGGTGAPTDYGSVLNVFDQGCVSCHSAGNPLGGLDLATDPCGALVNVPASAYDAVLVVPGDHASSVLWAKCADDGRYGSGMPTGGLSASELATLEGWIDAGAACGDTGVPPIGG